MVHRIKINGFNICRGKTSKWYVLYISVFGENQIIITVILGSTKRISNVDIINYLMQPAPKQQLSSMGIENIFPYTGFTEENLREYYENPPAGNKIFSY